MPVGAEPEHPVLQIAGDLPFGAPDETAGRQHRREGGGADRAGAPQRASSDSSLTTRLLSTSRPAGTSSTPRSAAAKRAVLVDGQHVGLHRERPPVERRSPTLAVNCCGSAAADVPRQARVPRWRLARRSARR